MAQMGVDLGRLLMRMV